MQPDVGDKVMLVESSPYYYQAPGLIGTITDVRSNGWCSIKWSNGHSNRYVYRTYRTANRTKRLPDITVIGSVENNPIKITMRRKIIGSETHGG